MLMTMLRGGSDFSGKTVVGRAVIEISVKVFSVDEGLIFDNRRFLVKDGIAYHLVFLAGTGMTGFEKQKGGIAVSVPGELGKVGIEPGAE